MQIVGGGDILGWARSAIRTGLQRIASWWATARVGLGERRVCLLQAEQGRAAAAVVVVQRGAAVSTHRSPSPPVSDSTAHQALDKPAPGQRLASVHHTRQRRGAPIHMARPRTASSKQPCAHRCTSRRCEAVPYERQGQNQE